MPSHYAHYRFGSQAVGLLPPQVQRRILRFRPLYDMGLYGPDLFYFYSLPMKRKVVELGSRYHKMTGHEFFQRVCKRLRLEPNEAALAYLYGVLTHYCLDSMLHGFVMAQSAEGQIGHMELEAEFDRYLMRLDGILRPNLHDSSDHMKLTQGECDTVAEFYGTSLTNVEISLKCMAIHAKLLAIPNRELRNLVKKCAGSRMRQNFAERTPNPKCAHLNEPLLALYDQALERLPAMMDQLLAHMSHNAALSEAFDLTFNG